MSVCTAQEEKTIKQFEIALRSFEDVQDFVSVATVQPFRILAGNARSWVNAKSFMGMFSLDFAQLVQIRADCTDVECNHFKAAAAKFLA